MLGLDACRYIRRWRVTNFLRRDFVLGAPPDWASSSRSSVVNVPSARRAFARASNSSVAAVSVIAPSLLPPSPPYSGERGSPVGACGRTPGSRGHAAACPYGFAPHLHALPRVRGERG